jgi:hypothetical protein
MFNYIKNSLIIGSALINIIAPTVCYYSGYKKGKNDSIKDIKIDFDIKMVPSDIKNTAQSDK